MTQSVSGRPRTMKARVQSCAISYGICGEHRDIGTTGFPRILMLSLVNISSPRFYTPFIHQSITGTVQSKQQTASLNNTIQKNLK
jgi:hypothetical protein